LRDDFTRFVLEMAECGLEPVEWVAVEAKPDRRHPVDAAGATSSPQAEATPGDAAADQPRNAKLAGNAYSRAPPAAAVQTSA
jgi:hypothetical protein